ncbi:MAG: cytochrome c family protein [Proteobacteria bacterium]|nr:MAG: cytochrome c family protein [Pseudomonadota bacterium]
MRALVIAAVTLAASTVSTFAQDVAAGETSFGKCRVCHDVGEDAKNKLGPILNGLDGRKAGSVEGANYSPALKNSGITWSEETFKDFIKNPGAKVPGTMMFITIPDPKEAGDVWAYIKQFGPDGKKKS